ncbi:hypothetical protein Pla52o_44840 [Novipirellula galeiformis]|uniref:DUF1269 domain-containing protein n=2 Tax=Novipirellula galeiformis TaxID=2528004 RepID=A0A5C6CB38_9BACT|nr:hypothetical protein Pla52o_44840 [Novipirellula galeiformis]
MHAACLVAEYESHKGAKIGLEVLRKFDFHADAVSVCWRGHVKALEKVHRSDEEEDNYGAEKSMGIGAAIAALAGTPLAVSSIMGPIMIAGPLAAAAGGAALAAMASEGDSLSTLHHSSSDRVDSRGLFAMANHYGINSHKAEHYEERIRNGGILIIVTSTPPRLDEAQRGLKTTNPASLQRFAYRPAANAGE